jgi:tRNA-5-methyluridine54 2-sulfurtransferase
MKCTKCGATAVIGMRQHRLNLCAEHFLEWVPGMVARAIDKYGMFLPDERLLVAVSGGKDSLSLWDILIHLGYQTEGLHINLGIDHERYSDISEGKVRAFAAAQGGLPFRVVNVGETYGKTVPDLARTRRGRRVCSVCGLVKRHIMNRVASEGGYAAIVTGHNLDDEAATLLGNTLHWQAGYLLRQAPVLPEVHPRLARKAKPLCHLYEREVAAYALLRGIDYVEEECPYAVKAKSIFYKKILNQIEQRSPGTKLQFYLEFLHARESGLFRAEAAEWPGEARQEIDAADPTIAMGGVNTTRSIAHTCPKCGQPTMAEGLCAFCRLMEVAP